MLVQIQNEWREWNRCHEREKDKVATYILGILSIYLIQFQ